MKKIALLLFGISKKIQLHWHQKFKLQEINYLRSYSNYQEFIFGYFQRKGYLIDVYLSTNKLKKKDRKALIKTYNPILSSFNKDHPNKHLSRNQKLDRVIDLCLEKQINYDLVLLTRFDLLFKKEFGTVNINFSKFNLVSRLSNPKLICDNFYLFPYSLLPQFSQLVKNNIKKPFHRIKKELYKMKIKNGKRGRHLINYILDEKRNIGSLSFYSISRKQINTNS